jgi:hypothetical protein
MAPPYLDNVVKNNVFKNTKTFYNMKWREYIRHDIRQRGY